MEGKRGLQTSNERRAEGGDGDGDHGCQGCIVEGAPSTTFVPRPRCAENSPHIHEHRPEGLQKLPDLGLLRAVAPFECADASHLTARAHVRERRWLTTPICAPVRLDTVLLRAIVPT
jgi:hypothetical protein